MDKSLVSKKAARDELWRRGNISLFKLSPEQKDFATKIAESAEPIPVILCSRRIGKTHFALSLAVDTCLKQKNSIVKFLAPTRQMLKSIIEPMMTELLEDCPDEIRPQYLKNQNTYKFQNGSMLQMAGTDSGNAERLRGGSSHLCIVDEAQSCNDLTNAVRSVLIPTTTTTNGKVVLIGTAPEDTEHDFMKFIEEADMKGVLIKKTIYESTRITGDLLKRIIDSYPGGVRNPTFRREYLCEIIKNSEFSAIPEFDDELEKEIVKEWERPPFYDYYESMDLGGKDLTVVLFAYYDFKNAVVVIEDELVLDFQEKDNNIAKLVKCIKEKEEQWFSDPIVHEVKTPFCRVSDIDYIALKEIRQHSNNTLNFSIAKKDEKAAAVNNLRILLANKRIIINPRCKTLVKHLRNVKWSKSNRNIFARSVDNAHYDAVDALIYLTRVVVYGRNPYPANYGLNQKDLIIMNENKKQHPDSAVDIFRALFKVGKKYGR